LAKQKIEIQNILNYRGSLMIFNNTVKAQSISQESIAGRDDRQQVTDTLRAPWNRIAFLTLRSANGKLGGGSGALIDPYHILTAGHVVYDKASGGWADPKSIDVSLGQNITDRYYGTAKATQIRSFKKWTSQGDSGYDMAVITLDRNIGNFTGWFNYRAESNAALNRAIVNLAGYPDDKAENFPSKVAGVLSAPMYTASGRVRTVTANRLIYNNAIDTDSGESGAPVWKYIPSTGNRQIVGVHTNGDPKGNFGSRLTPDKFNAIQSWIKADNLALKPSDRPDLVDYDAWFGTQSADFASSGGQFSVNAFVRNNGTAPAGRFQVSFYASSDTSITPGDYKLGDVTVDALNAFEWKKVSLQGALPSLPAASYFIGWQIDSSNAQAEFDESNNTGLFNRSHASRSRQTRQVDSLTGMQRGKAIAGQDKTFNSFAEKANVATLRETAQIHFKSNQLNPNRINLLPQVNEGIIGSSPTDSQLKQNHLPKFSFASNNTALSEITQLNTYPAIYHH
jgi:V8-like Glu-specific endopeptidase